MCLSRGHCTRSACQRLGSSPTRSPMPMALPTPRQGEEHLRLQRDLRLGPGRGQEAEEAEHHPQDGPGPHPPCAKHQQGEQPAGLGASLPSLLPWGGCHTAPAMMLGCLPCRCGAEPRGNPVRCRPRSVAAAARRRQGSLKEDEQPKTQQGLWSAGTQGCCVSPCPEERSGWQGAPRRELQQLRNPLPALNPLAKQQQQQPQI